VDFIALIVFVLVQILFIPVAVVGVVLVFYKQMYGSKKLGVSSTAVEVINGRWTMDVFGMREDSAAVRLNRMLPNNSVPGMWMVLFPSYLRYRISGKNQGYPSFARPGEEGISSIVTSRTVYFDRVINRSKLEVEQFVVMGAGFDTRCYGDLGNSRLTCYELDQARTQQLKKTSLAKAGIDSSHVRFVSVDFSNERWFEKLEQVGYDPARKSLFLWEGVTLYLSEQDVRDTLRDIKANAAPGSILLADFYALSFVTGEYAPGMKKSIKLLKITDEEFGFGIDFSSNPEIALRGFVESEHARLGETFVMGANTKKGAYMIVAEVVI
jgi:methyltransferase (TIGR00027 family)